MKICVLRLGHRPERDKRITTHVALTARAFGCTGMFLAGMDEKIRESINRVNENWGGKFFVEFVKDWKTLIREWDGIVIHLTMYGIPLLRIQEKIQPEEPILVVVGAEKVPKEVYEMVDYNVSIGLQPHSEVAALAVFLDRITDGKEFTITFPDGKMKVVPTEKGKVVEKYDE
jgi:tRNA (cytidine56-2'-O)-methyltransferase